MLLRSAAAFAVSFIVTVATGHILIPALLRRKAGQAIREDGPVWHNKKEGTPTLGGLMFIVGIAVSCLTVGFSEIKGGEFNKIFMFIFALIFAGIGFLDDKEKLKNKRNLGLKASQKFALQLVVSILFVLLLRLTGRLSPALYIPFVNIYLRLPLPLYYIFVAFVAVGTVNSVNITDGADGLATGVSIPIAICFTAISILWSAASLGIFSAALSGGLIAFLIFNFYPAKIFMGDTGAQFLGGVICAFAFAFDMPLILIPLGIVYFVETLSDIIQIIYFKATHGKRYFKMAPLHHHLELCGWSEYKLFIVFTAVSAVFSALSFFGVYNRIF